METFKPTDEQLFDYHLGMAEPQVTRQIDAYLKDHPEAQNQLKEFARIEEGFKNFPIAEPSAQVLERVRETAQRYAKPGLWQFLKTPLGISRKLAWSLMIFLVIGLGFALQELRDSNPYEPGLVKTPVATTTNGNAAEEVTANFSGSLTQKAMQPVELNGDAAKILEEYTKALSYYHQSRFKEASDLFSQIMTTQPLFSKRVDLYSFWISALDKMGDQEMAEQKRQELEKIKSELESDDTM